jgi:TonB family protein
MNHSKSTGAAATIIFHALLLAALFAWGLPIPYPPPPEDGMLISFGNVEHGRGEIEPSSKEMPHSEPSFLPNTNDKEPMLTQQYEDAPIINTKAKKRRKTKENPAPAAIPRHHASEQPRIVNRDALFSGKNSGDDNKSRGEGTDGAAAQNQGSPDGSSMTASAQGHGGGNSFVLKGRNLVGTLPVPQYEVQDAGRVVVKIKVDRAGNVVEAKAQQSGSTLMNATLYAAAEQAASRAKFNPAQDGAPPFQNGTIIYVFRMSGM